VRHLLARTSVALLAWLALTLAFGAGDALASYGHGLYGDVSDTVVTLAGFCVIGFFVVFVTVMSLLQGWLERRKEARKAAHAALGNGRWRGGW
jgi:O-antigen/teichoic acid export membrane protein